MAICYPDFSFSHCTRSVVYEDNCCSDGLLSSKFHVLCITVHGEDMDISPGGTAEEEARPTEQTSTITVPSDLESADLYTAVGSLAEDSTSDSSFLNTLAKLQQALQQVTADKFSSGNSPKAVPSSVLSLLATLPSLICKLKSAGVPQTSALSQPADQHQITVQGQCFHMPY